MPDGNREAFMEAAGTLRGEGWTVENPIEHPRSAECFQESQELGEDYRDGPVYRSLMRDFYYAILHSQRLFVLPGWELAGGARAEVFFASTVGTPIWGYHRLRRKRWRLYPRLEILLDANVGGTTRWADAFMREATKG